VWKADQQALRIQELRSSAVAAFDLDHNFGEMGVRFEDTGIGDFV
jgi:hypothetical protein